ncbi:MAG: metallophosphoesterase [Spirochaetaceae bacterium]|jgi:Icc-related predicted phosphoesterase|nr:metallophosphoesterase [Spirochaetaceae bacterium]
MKILCISDEIASVIYSNLIKERFSDIDFVLAAGDLPLDYLEFIVSTLNKPLLFVFGNHNLGDFHFYKKGGYAPFELNLPKYFSAGGAGAIHIGSKVVKEEQLIFAGLGGSMRYNNGENQFTNLKMKFEMVKIIPRLFWNKFRYGRYLDILLTHAPPKGIHDKEDICHRGFSEFLWFMRFFKPKYLVHGHIHLFDNYTERKTRYYTTQVVNAFNHCIIEID